MYRIRITEAFEIEGASVEAHDKIFHYFGVAIGETRKFPFRWCVDWNLRFYATKAGDCYQFLDGHYMPNTSASFKQLLSQNVALQNENEYVRLLEQAKRIV